MSPLEVTVPPDMDLLTPDFRNQGSFPGRLAGADCASLNIVPSGEAKPADILGNGKLDGRAINF